MEIYSPDASRLATIADKWREKAVDMERSAKNHTRSCVHAKAAQLILGAKLLRNCASEIDREAIKIAKAADGGSDAPVRTVEIGQAPAGIDQPEQVEG
jgi:hypothetical protein